MSVVSSLMPNRDACGECHLIEQVNSELGILLSMQDRPSRKTKKEKTTKTQYMLYYRTKPNADYVAFGPIHSKKSVMKDVAFYKGMFGEDAAYWEVYDPNARKKRSYGDRRRHSG